MNQKERREQYRTDVLRTNRAVLLKRIWRYYRMQRRVQILKEEVENDQERKQWTLAIIMDRLLKSTAQKEVCRRPSLPNTGRAAQSTFAMSNTLNPVQKRLPIRIRYVNSVNFSISPSGNSGYQNTIPSDRSSCQDAASVCLKKR